MQQCAPVDRHSSQTSAPWAARDVMVGAKNMHSSSGCAVTSRARGSRPSIVCTQDALRMQRRDCTAAQRHRLTTALDTAGNTKLLASGPRATIATLSESDMQHSAAA